MESNEISPPAKHPLIPDEMKRAKYWANLLDKATDKYDIYILAKSNLDSTNKNSIKREKAKKILEEAIKRYEEIYNR
jgi:hypothetical protein